MSNEINIVWFRNDLRVIDNPALFEAAKSGNILPIYILDDSIAEEFKIGSASRYWLHNSLESLNKSLVSKLNVYCGNSKDILLSIINRNEFSVKSIFYNKIFEPWHIKNDAKIEEALKAIGIKVKSFNASLLWDPEEVKKFDGNIYKVFTPFYRNGCANAKSPRQPLPIPPKISIISDVQPQTKISDLKLLPRIKWYKEIEETWEIGEQAAQNKLQYFLDNNIASYKENRNYPSKINISRLSPHLHFGEISPNQIYYAAQLELAKYPANSPDIDCFLSEIAWREFSYYLLYHFPELPVKNFQSKFDNFPWNSNSEALDAWKRGMTGYPIVDAGMRQLWQTGFMHNRVRMIVASFLIKNLLIHWREGAKWFWDCLVDADLASNSASWQWVAGSGADAAPYFRIFNPVLQGEKFDPDGIYIRQFVPELSKLPNQYLFKPWESPSEVLKAAGVALGKTYPLPIVDMKISRDRALSAYKTL